jgi:hypothetical protein
VETRLAAGGQKPGRRRGRRHRVGPSEGGAPAPGMGCPRSGRAGLVALAYCAMHNTLDE